ncbi:hypothetical protein GCM10023185_13450 [Hymenobacter saemangeumensis]|uniref:Uncharacterized protein n=1 Tax=Hymenobacter saemangeumensis TaxID=1084522 RepID=A0ABP8I8C2_9BACT
MGASTAQAQNDPRTFDVAAVQAQLTSTTWKVAGSTVNGFSPAEFTKANNIKNVDAFKAGDRYVFKTDGTYQIISAAGGARAGIWEMSGQSVMLDPGKAGGGTRIDVTYLDKTRFVGRTFKRLGMCDVTSMYEIGWVPATM